MNKFGKMYLKTITVLTLISIFSAANAKNNDVLKPINAIFDAMRAHNSAQFLAQFSDNARLIRVNKNGAITHTDLTTFANFVGATDKYLDEQLFNINVNRLHNLATVWTPFMFYLNGKLSHCGVNSFQLTKKDGKWLIVSLIDEAYRGDCQEFKHHVTK